MMLTVIDYFRVFYMIHGGICAQCKFGAGFSRATYRAGERPSSHTYAYAFLFPEGKNKHTCYISLLWANVGLWTRTTLGCQSGHKHRCYLIASGQRRAVDLIIR